MKKFVMVMYLLAVSSIPCFSGAHVESTLSSEFLKKVKPIAGSIFSGYQPDGTLCSVAVLDVVEPGYFDDFAPSVSLPDSQSISVVGANYLLPAAITNAVTTDDILKLVNPIVIDDSNRSQRVFRASAGWSTNRGSAKADGKVTGFGGNNLEFYWAGYIPQQTDATVTLTEDGTAIEKVEFYSYKNWYLPVIQWSPKSVKFSCQVE
ncbi:MAG: hypothetical protein ACXWRE_09225 [Pseudobdellovibrionaceae bacterium]